MERLRRALSWLYPGIGVKRWAALAAAGALLAAVGLLAWFGRDLVRSVYQVLSPTDQNSYWIAIGLLVAGLALLVGGINRIVHAIVSGIAPETAGRASEVLSSRRKLSRGPKVVALGGGTGLSSLLRGLKRWTAHTTAVVTVMDDGGSSGRLRAEMNMLPPGDIRNCLIALAEDESHIAALFQHRFADGSGGLDGHSLGNLILAGLQQHTGSFDTAIEQMSHILKVRGQVLPATLEDVRLVAEMDDGSTVIGEVQIAEDKRKIRHLRLSKPRVRPYEKVIKAIEEADLVLLGPGSLFTSIVPNLLVDGVARAVERSGALKVYVANLMTQPGETDGFALSDHLRALGHYLDLKSLDCVVANDAPFSPELESQYGAEGASPVALDDIHALTPARLVAADLCDVRELVGRPTLKHHPERLTEALAECARRAGVSGTKKRAVQGSAR